MKRKRLWVIAFGALLTVSALGICLIPRGGGEVANASDGIRLIPFEDFEFQEPLLRNRLAAVEAEAGMIAGPEWRYVPWHYRGATGQTPETHYIFASQWCESSEGSTHCHCTHDTAPCHKIDIVASPRESAVGKPKKIHSWSLIAAMYPESSKWGARISYSENWHQGVQVQEHFTVFLDNMHADPADTPDPGDPSKGRFRLPCNRYELRHRFDSYEYVFQVNLEHPRKPEFEARRHLSSADSLRESVLKALDKCQAQVESMIKTGQATRVADYNKMVSQPPTENPPVWGPPEPAVFESPVPAEYALTEAQKETLLAKLNAELDARRDLIKTDAEEIHAAIEATFPLGKVLAELDQVNR